MIGYIIVALVGWLVGGFANWAADTFPALNKSEQRGLAPSPPHDWTLSWFLWRRRRCPHCDLRLATRRPLLELGIILLFIFWWWFYAYRPLPLLLSWLYSTFLLLVLVIDIEHRRVLNIMTGPAAVMAIFASFLPIGPSPTEALVGGIVGYLGFGAIRYIGGGRLGMGDVKLAGVIGLMVGFPLVIRTLLIAMILGAVGATALLITRRAGRRDFMAYAPYMSVATLVALTLG